jgi:hypothetical protein
VTADTFLLSDTHHDESTACQVKSILLQFISKIVARWTRRSTTATAISWWGKIRFRRKLAVGVCDPARCGLDPYSRSGCHPRPDQLAGKGP